MWNLLLNDFIRINELSKTQNCMLDTKGELNLK